MKEDLKQEEKKNKLTGTSNTTLSPKTNLATVPSYHTMKSKATLIPHISNSHDGETFLIKCIAYLYRRWAYFIADHYIAAIILPLLVSIICTMKMINTPYENDPLGSVPYGARGRYEYTVQEEFANVNGQGILLLATIVAKDDGSVLKEEVLREANEVDEIISNNFTLYNHIIGKEESYNEFCRSFCLMNVPLQQFYVGFLVQLELLKAHQPLNDRIHLDYPVSHIYGQPINIQLNFNGIVLKNDTLLSRNETTRWATEMINYAPLITNMESAKLIKLAYRGERVGNWTIEETGRYEMSIVEYFQNVYKPKYIRVMILTLTYVVNELNRAGLAVVPFIVVGFIVMAFCSTISTLISAAYMKQKSFHKIYLAIFGCICPIMANGTANGLLLWLGVRYDPILYVSAFLVLAIGVDDSYLMIHAWHRVTLEYREHPVKDDGVSYRLAKVLHETGPAILISALTNILADAVGTYTGSPAITILCLGNMASVFFDYVYQLTFAFNINTSIIPLTVTNEISMGFCPIVAQFMFVNRALLTFYTGIMCIAGHYEMKKEAEHQNTHSIEIDNEIKCYVTSCCGENPRGFRRYMKGGCAALLEGYIRLVTNTIFAIIIFCGWMIFIAVSIYGITQLKIELTAEKLFSEDSPLIEANNLLEKYQVAEHTTVQFYVSNPGNLSDPVRLKLLNQLVYEVENMNNSWGAVGTHYFIRDFIDYEQQFDESEGKTDPDYGTSTGIKEREIPAFLSWPEYEKWKGFIIFNETAGHIERFFFMSAFYGENLKQWPERGILLNNCRKIVDKYGTLNVSVYMDDGLFLDLVDNMPTDAWQSALAILGCMVLISSIFLWNAFTVIVVAAAILSIMTGITGIMSLIGINLEPIMLSAMLISMGFSVDIPGHITYHYNTADMGANRRLTVAEKLRICFSSVALPALQASTSTSLCVLSLLFVTVYMAQVFVRMMVLCIFLCVIHGLVIIPCILVLIDLLQQLVGRLQNRSIVSPSTKS